MRPGPGSARGRLSARSSLRLFLRALPILCPLRAEGGDALRLRNLESSRRLGGVVEVGKRDARQGLADGTVDRAQVVLFVSGHEGEGFAGHFGARGSPDAVDVIFGGERHIKVDYVPQFFDIDAA